MIYALLDPRTSQARYVGFTRNARRRLKEHSSPANNTGKTYRERWIRGLLAKGLSPNMILLEEAPDDWQEAEQFWIECLRSLGARLTNLTAGGEGCIPRRQPLVPRELTKRVRAAFSKFAGRPAARRELHRAFGRLRNRFGMIGGAEMLCAFVRRYC